MSTTIIPFFYIPTIEADSPYHYRPSRNVAIIFIVLYAVSTLTHAAQAARYRMWWLLPTVCLGGMLEILGWSGRLWSSISPFLITPFQIQITCTIIAPTPILAANFVVFGEIIKALGCSYSRLGSKWYTIIFCTCDVISLVVQGVGGGLAATANTLVSANQGAHIMLGGIGFQLVVILAFSICAIEFLFRYHRDSPASNTMLREKSLDGVTLPSRGSFTRNRKIMVFALGFNTLCLLTRAVYRMIELSGGWNGRIIHTEVLFNVLDGAMVTLAIYTLNFAHPGILLAEGEAKAKSDVSP